MAQKKVILKDGSDDLLPKTLASMVFTEAGQTVEAALQSAGGGGSSSGGGTGNVNVTNGSGLQKDAYYAFQPSAAGSLTGKFATIPNANADSSGLMSSAAYTRLYSFDQEVELPKAIDLVTSSSTELNILQLIGAIYNKRAMDNFEGVGDITDEQLEILKGYGKEMMSGLAQGIADGTWGYAYTYNHSRISVVPTFTPPASGEGNQYEKASLELTYVSSGKLRTVTLTATLNSSGETATYDFTAKVEESGDDTYWLPTALRNITSANTPAEVFEALGGEAGYNALHSAIENGKKIYLSGDGLFKYSSPVFASNMIAMTRLLYFIQDMLGSVSQIIIFINGYEPSTKIQEIYPSGYTLSPSLYSLTTSSSSDEISTAVGGEYGLKEIIQAVKDGNRLVIRGTPPDDLDIGQLSTDVLMNQYKESENGDIQITYTLFGWAQGVGYLGGSIYVLHYEKSSNTFSMVRGNFQVSS